METDTYLVGNAQAEKSLGVSRTYLAALKKAVGCGGSHKFKLSWLTDYLDSNPNFKARPVGRRKRKSGHGSSPSLAA